MSEETTQPLPNDTLRLILARLDSIDARLTTLEEKVDRRLQETRPIWEQVLTRLDTLEAEVSQFRAETNTAFSRIELQVDTLNRNVFDLQTEQRGLSRRISKLESEPAQ